MNTISILRANDFEGGITLFNALGVTKLQVTIERSELLYCWLLPTLGNAVLIEIINSICTNSVHFKIVYFNPFQFCGIELLHIVFLMIRVLVFIFD